MEFTKIGNRIVFAECYDSSINPTPHIVITKDDLSKFTQQGGAVEDAFGPADN